MSIPLIYPSEAWAKGAKLGRSLRRLWNHYGQRGRVVDLVREYVRGLRNGVR